MSSILFLDPLRMAAAVSMTTPEQDARLAKILDVHANDDIERCIVSSRYVIDLFGLEKIEKQYERMLRGEIECPPMLRHLL